MIYRTLFLLFLFNSIGICNLCGQSDSSSTLTNSLKLSPRDYRVVLLVQSPKRYVGGYIHDFNQDSLLLSSSFDIDNGRGRISAFSVEDIIDLNMPLPIKRKKSKALLGAVVGLGTGIILSQIVIPNRRPDDESILGPGFSRIMLTVALAGIGAGGGSAIKIDLPMRGKFPINGEYKRLEAQRERLEYLRDRER